MKKHKKILALTLALVMCISLLSAVIFPSLTATAEDVATLEDFATPKPLATLEDSATPEDSASASDFAPAADFAPASAPAAPNSTDTWDFTHVTQNGSGSGWSWVNSTKTLTLTNFTHTTSAEIALRVLGGTTIVLNGNNTITSTYSGTSDHSGAIIASGDLTIRSASDGKLTALGGAGSSSLVGFSAGDAIVAFGDLTINNSTVTATAGGTGEYANGIYAERAITINNSTVTATGGTASGGSVGIYAYGDSVTINNSTVVATGNDGIFCYFYSEYGGNITINNSTVTATGSAGSGSYGIRYYSYYSEESDDTLKVTNGAVVTASGSARAIYVIGHYDIGGYAYTVPAGVKYKVATNMAGTEGVQEGTSNGTFVIGSTHKYARLEPGGDPGDDVNCPIVIIPGIMGSNLYLPSTT